MLELIMNGSIKMLKMSLNYFEETHQTAVVDYMDATHTYSGNFELDIFKTQVCIIPYMYQKNPRWTKVTVGS